LEVITKASKGPIYSLFEVEWKKPKHHLLVEFLNTWKDNHNKLEMFARIGDKVCVVDKFILGKRFKIFTMG
jgi:hypothetical protein